MKLVKIAVATMRSTNSKSANVATMRNLMKNAAASGATMIFFPEVASYMSVSSADTISNADSVDGPTVQQLREEARISNIWLSSCLHEKSDNGDSDHRVYNSQLMINPKGDVVSLYRKIHLFDISIPDKGISLMESHSIRPGNQYVPCTDTPVGNVGLATCYDMRFPEMTVKLREMGASLLTFPSAFTVPTGKAHWHTLLRARAIESQCFVVAAAQVGQHNEKRQSYGHSLVVSPWGEVLYDGGGYSSEGFDETTQELDFVGFVEIDLALVDEVRTKMPIAAHRESANKVVEEKIL